MKQVKNWLVKKVDFSSLISMIILNVNYLNIPAKREIFRLGLKSKAKVSSVYK